MHGGVVDAATEDEVAPEEAREERVVFWFCFCRGEGAGEKGQCGAPGV